jgi:hypothetical protein
MANYENAVNKVESKLPEGFLDKNGIDPVSIAVIIEMIMKIIASIQQCRTPTPVVVAAKQKTRGNRLIVAMSARRELGRRKYRQCGDTLVTAIVDAAAEASEEEFAEFME